MSEEQKCCGTCKWFVESRSKGVILTWGRCTCKVLLPSAFRDLSSLQSESMSAAEGTECPCWEPRT